MIFECFVNFSSCEGKLSMPIPMRIIPNDHGVLTLPAYAILDNMLNVPERTTASI